MEGKMRRALGRKDQHVSNHTRQLAPAKQRRSRALWHRMLDVGERMLVTEGFHELSLDRLGKELGIAKGTPYRYVSDKGALAIAILARMNREQRLSDSGLRLIYRFLTGTTDPHHAYKIAEEL